MARPLREFDREMFEKACEIQCTESDICHLFGTTNKTLSAWCKRVYKKSFQEVFQEKRIPGLYALRRAQYDAALTGNATMLIWLGKQWLNQSEKPLENNHSSMELSDEVEELLKELEE